MRGIVLSLLMFSSVLGFPGAHGMAEAPGWLGPPKKAPQDLCEAIVAVGIHFGIKDPKLSLAIAYTESSYRNVVSADGRDIGYFQINRSTAVIYGMDQKKLLENLLYQTTAHFVILQDKLRLCAHLKEDAFSCYHSTTPKYREVYAKKVKHFYNLMPSFAEACSN